MPAIADRARAFLAGKALPFEEANVLWKDLQKADELSLARRVLERVRDGKGLMDSVPADRRTRTKLCQQEALLTSKDPELNTTVRHDRGSRFWRRSLVTFRILHSTATPKPWASRAAFSSVAGATLASLKTCGSCPVLPARRWQGLARTVRAHQRGLSG